MTKICTKLTFCACNWQFL